MKHIVIVTIAFFIGANVYGQSNQATTPEQKLPPMSMLPKDGEVKQIYELPEAMDYEIFNGAGEVIQKGTAEFIDYTKFKKGTYFIKYGDKAERFIKE